MNLDDTIKQTEEIAKLNRDEYAKYGGELQLQCAEYHEQLAEWLKDYKRLLEQEPKTGHWSRKTKVDAYDIAGVKTWGIKCQCDKCDFTTIVVEDFGYYKYCPNCGAKMAESEE